MGAVAVGPCVCACWVRLYQLKDELGQWLRLMVSTRTDELVMLGKIVVYFLVVQALEDGVWWSGDGVEDIGKSVFHVCGGRFALWLWGGLVGTV
jgi:hypothetical protein